MARQVPPKNMGAADEAAQLVQLVASPMHVWHVALQLKQTPRPLVVLGYCPMAQAELQLPVAWSNVAPATQDVQLLGPAPLQDAQEASHGWQL